MDSSSTPTPLTISEQFADNEPEGRTLDPEIMSWIVRVSGEDVYFVLPETLMEQFYEAVEDGMDHLATICEETLRLLMDRITFEILDPETDEGRTRQEWFKADFFGPESGKEVPSEPLVRPATAATFKK